MKYIQLVGLTMFLLFSFSGVAQNKCTYSVYGTISDEHDGSPLAFATVSILGSAKGAAADWQGNYKLDALCLGQVSLVISHLACESDTIRIEVKGNEKHDFLLEHHDAELIEVEIRERKQQNQGLTQAKISDSEKTESQGKSLAEVVASVNGVNSLKTGANISKPVIGGFSSNRVQIINGGVQHQSQQWGDEHAPEIDANAELEYTVIKGAGSVRYADGAIGGTVLVEPKALPVEPGIAGAFHSLYASNNRLMGSSLSLEGKLKALPRFSWRAQGSFKRSGNIKTPNYYQKNTGLREENYSWQAAYRTKKIVINVNYSQFNSKVGILSAAHIGNLSDLKAAIDRLEPREEDQSGFSYNIERPYQLISHEFTKAELRYYLSEKTVLTFQLSRQFNIREEFDKERPRNALLAAANIPEFSLSLESLGTEVCWEYKPSNKFKSSFGIQANQSENSINSFTDFIPDYQAQSISFFASESYTSNGWELSSGIRLSQVNYSVSKFENRQYQSFRHDFMPLTVHAGVGKQIGQQFRLNSNLFYAERSPAINELYSDGLHHGSASIESGDRNLVKEKAWGFNTQLLGEFKKLTIDLYAYAQLIDQFIYLNPEGLELTIRGAFPAYQWKNTTAQLLGFDAGFDYALRGNLLFKYKLSALWAENKKEDKYLIFMPANRMEFRMDYTFNPLVKESQRVSLGAGLLKVFQQNRTNPLEEFAEAPSGYHLVFLNLKIPIKIRKNLLLINLRADNLLNEAYRDYLNRFRYYSDEQGRDIRIGLNYKF